MISGRRGLLIAIFIGSVSSASWVYVRSVMESWHEQGDAMNAFLRQRTIRVRHSEGRTGRRDLIERENQRGFLVGNIYKGRVPRSSPGLQSAVHRHVPSATRSRSTLKHQHRRGVREAAPGTRTKKTKTRRPTRLSAGQIPAL